MESRLVIIKCGGYIFGQLFLLQLCTYHSIASSRPSPPLTADVLKIAQVLDLRADKPNSWETSVGVMAPSIS